MPSMMAIALGGGALVGVLLVYAAFAEYREGRGDEVIRNSSETAASGVQSGITLGRAAGFGAFMVIQTVLAEFLNIGMSIFDILGPMVASNLLAIGVGSLGFAGIIPVDPWWYAGVMLMIFGIALSSAGEEIFERYAG